MFEAVESLVEEHAALERRLADPDVFSDLDKSRMLNQRYAALTAVVKAYSEWQTTLEDLQVAHELAAEDPGFADEA